MAFRLNYQSAALRVCVDEAGGGKFQGRVVSQRLSAPMVFHDVDFFTQIDAILNEQKYPQAFQRVRTFSEKRSLEVPVALSEEEMSDPESVDCAEGRVTTFLIQITSRQNSSWQGYIDWLDGSGKQNFESTLEFIRFVYRRLGMITGETRGEIPRTLP